MGKQSTSRIQLDSDRPMVRDPVDAEWQVECAAVLAPLQAV